MNKFTVRFAQIVLFFLILSQLEACQLFKKVQITNPKNPGEIVEENFDKKQINIRIPVNSKFVFVSGQEIPLDSPPAYIDENSTTMVPLRFISDVIGAKVDWVAETKEIFISQDTKEIKLQVNNYIALVNLTEVQLVSPPQIKEERAFVPLKFIAQNLGFNSEWIPETKTIILTK